MKVISYSRVSTIEQDTKQQQEQIQAYCYRNKLEITDTIKIKISSKKDTKERMDFLDELQEDDILIVVALDRLGRSTLQVLKILEDLSKRGIIVHIINDNLIVSNNDDNPITKLTLTILSAFSELERSFISRRTKAALAQKKKDGVTLGRPKGSTSKSQYDKDKEKIKELVNYGVPISKIVNQIGYGTRQSLSTYLKREAI